MKTQQNIPLVGQPDQLVPRQWPNVAADHHLPVRQARTEATVSAAIMAVCGGAVLILTSAPLIFLALLALAVLLMWLVMFLLRYEEHIQYVRDDRTPPAPLDLDADGKPDNIEAVWYSSGALPVAADTLDGIYRRQFAEFCAACVLVDTDIRALRRSGFDDSLQALFRDWLIARGAGTWHNPNAHTLGWRIVGEDELRHVMRCTGWKEAR